MILMLKNQKFNSEKLPEILFGELIENMTKDSKKLLFDKWQYVGCIKLIIFETF